MAPFEVKSRTETVAVAEGHIVQIGAVAGQAPDNNNLTDQATGRPPRHRFCQG